MLHGVLGQVVDDHTRIVEREKGVAFLAAACPIYQLTHLYYFCANIPRPPGGSFVQCAFSSDFASQAITTSPVTSDKLDKLEIVRLARQRELDSTAPASRSVAHDGREIVVSAIRLAARGQETAIFGFARGASGIDAPTLETPSIAELTILGNYFHSHMLRRNGIDASEALVVSARELDCLRWVAAGKSAWEASVILGISERTVRFHLNSAREKLNCTTTTQAVAKVVAQQLISV